MKEYRVEKAYAGSRFDKYLKRLLPNAPWSLIQRLIRTRGVNLNGRKAHADDLLGETDVIRLYLPDEKILDLEGGNRNEEEKAGNAPTADYEKARKALSARIRIVYEDPALLAAFKPAGVLSQKAEKNDLSLNEWFVGYLLKKQEIAPKDLSMYTPSVVNRLDRNTEGLVLCAKTYEAGRALSKALKERTIHKYYETVVKGDVKKGGTIEGYLVRDEKSGVTKVVREKQPGADFAKTIYRPLKVSSDGSCTLLSAELVTGKTHQLRAHFASIGHPILGDPKYGDRKRNDQLHLSHQLLCCVRVVFPAFEEAGLQEISGQTIEIAAPDIYHALVR